VCPPFRNERVKAKGKRISDSDIVSPKQLVKSSIRESRVEDQHKVQHEKHWPIMMLMRMKMNLTKFEEATDSSGFHPLQGLHLTSAKWQMKVTNIKKCIYEV
jgi:hypothetical protein